MKKIIQKNINGISIVIAENDSNELKIGNDDDYKNYHMSSFILEEDCWFGIGHNLLHIAVRNDRWMCNIGSDLPESNNEFPFEFLEEFEALLLEDR